jgi:hypothetical protein
LRSTSDISGGNGDECVRNVIDLTVGRRNQAALCRRVAARMMFVWDGIADVTNLGLTPPGYGLSPLRGWDDAGLRLRG